MEEFCDLERARQLNDMRLEHAFENIFARYSKDFTEVGDEIDLTTGEVVVNNGHLSGMRGEQDVGDRPGRTLLRSLAIESTGTQPSMAPDEEDELFMEQNALCVVPQVNAPIFVFLHGSPTVSCWRLFTRGLTIVASL